MTRFVPTSWCRDLSMDICCQQCCGLGCQEYTVLSPYDDDDDDISALLFKFPLLLPLIDIVILGSRRKYAAHGQFARLAECYRIRRARLL